MSKPGIVRTRIKFCGLVREVDVDRAVALGVDFIGFVFYAKSPRALRPEQAARLRRRLPSYVVPVGLFVNEAPGEIARIASQVGLGLLQLHGDESPEDCALSGARAGLPWWRALRVRTAPVLLESLTAHARAEAVLLDSDASAFGGSGRMFDWSLVPREREVPIVLAGGLTPETVGAGIAALAPMAVDVSSGIQGDDPRCKDPEKMARFVESVMAADAARAPARA